MDERYSGLDDGRVDFSELDDIYGHIAFETLIGVWAHYNTDDPSYLGGEDFDYS